MKGYHISIDGQQTGPHSIEEIKAMDISDKHLVWKEGFTEWVTISELNDFKDLISITPPPLPDKKFAESKAINKALIDSLLPFFLTLLIVFIASNGFLPDHELKQAYPNYSYEVQSSQIRLFIFCWSFMTALIPSLLVLIIDYRVRIKREISRLEV